VFVDGILCLDVEGSEENSRDLSDFVKWKWEGETSNDVVGHQFHEEVLLFDCAFVIAKEEGLLNVLYYVIFVKGLKGPLYRTCFIWLQLGWFLKISSSVSIGLNSDP
jgi:hypothetical protein